MKISTLMTFILMLISCTSSKKTTNTTAITDRQVNINKNITIAVESTQYGRYESSGVTGKIEAALFNRNYNVVSLEVARRRIITDIDKNGVNNNNYHKSIQTYGVLEVDAVYILQFTYEQTFEFMKSDKHVWFKSINIRIIDLTQNGKIIFATSLSGKDDDVIATLINKLENKQ